ncbi:MAP7 domain-containing protein 3-like, partial [Saccostrea cucullata]|uniref:MAP7 domain-containing protein 3-like n=1 Tax=Saccostrea cuccullata TaxID=36930 RepID=UPI002ED362D1
HSLETADVEYARKKEEERKEKERKRKQREEERKQRAEEEEKKRKQKEEERKKKAAEDEKRRKKEETKRKDMEAQKKEEDDKKQREIEAKKKEDEERQRKEREEKQAREKEKEERRRKEREEVERRKNWRNWPPMIFYRDDDATAFHKGVVCIALAMEGELVKEDLTCVGSDSNNEREKYLQAEKKEVPMSSLVTIKPSTKSAIRLQEPLHVFIPHQANQSSRDIVVKVSLDGGPWKTMEYEVAIPPSVNITDVHMVHIAINNFKFVGILVASRPKFHAFTVGKEGGTFEIKSPQKARLTVPNDCFNEKTNGTLQITDKKHTNAMAKDKKDLRNIQLALAPHNITFEKQSKSNVSLEIYPDLHRIIGRPQSALKTCEKTLLEEMDAETVAEDLHEKGIISSSTLKEIKYKKSKEEQVKALVEDLLCCDEEEFQQLIGSLEESNQQNLANTLRKALAKISRKEMGSDFVEETDDKVALLSSKNHQGWSVVDFEKVKDKSGACLLTLPPDGKSFSVIGLVVPKSFKDSELSRLAELFYVSSEQFRMRLIVKQHKETSAAWLSDV